MISLRLFLLILITLVCRELSGAAPHNAWHVALFATVGITVGCGLLFKATALAILLARPEDSCWVGIQRRRCQRARFYVEALWGLLLPVVLLGTGWGAWLTAFEDSAGSLSLALLAWFLPSLAVLLLLEVTSAQFDELLDESGAAETSPRGWPALLKQRLRFGELPVVATCLLPVLAICVCRDLGIAAVGKELSAGWIACVFLTSVGLSVTLIPSWLGWWIGAEAVQPSSLLNRFEAYRSNLRVPGLKLRIVRSDGRWHGAAAVGWLPGFRQLWIGDGLLSTLDDQELDMVLMHEMAHVTRRHFLWRLLPILGVASGLALLLLFVGLLPAVENQLLAFKLGAVATAVVCLVAGVSAISQHCELDADRNACRLAERACSWARAERGNPAGVLGQALTKLLDGAPEAAKTTWLHPSLQRRLRGLNEDRQQRQTRAGS